MENIDETSNLETGQITEKTKQKFWLIPSLVILVLLFVGTTVYFARFWRTNKLQTKMSTPTVSTVDNTTPGYYDELVKIVWDETTWHDFEYETVGLKMKYPSFLKPFGAYAFMSGEDLPEIEFLIEHPSLYEKDDIRPLPYIHSKLYHLSEFKVGKTYGSDFPEDHVMYKEWRRDQRIEQLVIDEGYSGEDYAYFKEGELEFTYFIRGGRKYVLEVKDNIDSKKWSGIALKLDIGQEDLTKTLIEITKSTMPID